MRLQAKKLVYPNMEQEKTRLEEASRAIAEMMNDDRKKMLETLCQKHSRDGHDQANV